MINDDNVTAFMSAINRVYYLETSIHFPDFSWPYNQRYYSFYSSLFLHAFVIDMVWSQGKKMKNFIVA